MAARPPSRSTSNLEPPRKSVELEDPGAHELDSSADEEYFSDASEGRRRTSGLESPLLSTSPIPKTRVERVDDKPSHGETPGSPAYNKRQQDAVPDELEIVPEGRLSKRNSTQFLEPTASPGGMVVPRTVVEKIDPSSPSYGDVPGTAAYEKRLADAAPDVVLKSPASGGQAPAFPLFSGNDEAKRTSPQQASIPETVITRVDSRPAHGEVSGTAAHDMRCQDAEPDVLERQDDATGSPTLDRLDHRIHDRQKPSLKATFPASSGASRGVGDDFDDFEEGVEAGADDDFGDFDDGFEEPAFVPDVQPPAQLVAQEGRISSFSLVNYQSISSFPDLLAATESHLDAMFPSTTSEKLALLPDLEPIPSDSPIFPSDRSRSLWKQLITPPPLQPPNWTKSRIRRLFLVSLGVPVDLDEILPPSKQKKLVLPDINLESSSRRSESDRNIGSVARLKSEAANGSNASVDSAQSTSKLPRRRPRGPAPPPELDLGAVKRLCATTSEKLNGLTDDELQAHVKSLEIMAERTSEVLEYWLKRRDGARKEKEAFEGVIENLVRHARRVRK